MTTKIVPLLGDIETTLSQLGMAEKESFLKIEARVQHLVSKSFLLRQGQDLINRCKLLLKKKDESFFLDCIRAYAAGLGVDELRYLTFLSMFEMAAHYGQIFPELKSILPGCTSLFEKKNGEVTHTRLFDFPLVDLFELKTRIYYWKFDNRPAIMSVSCEGLAPLFFQTLHESGLSIALHYKPGHWFHSEGQGIFQLLFDTLFDTKSANDFRKGIKRRESTTKWGLLLCDKHGSIFHIDIDGPSQRIETFNLDETTPLIFTNIPLQMDEGKHLDSYLRFSQMRQDWLKRRLPKSRLHPIDLMTNVSDDKDKDFIHPTATLATVGAYHLNLTRGVLELKSGQGALTASDETIAFHLGEIGTAKIVKPTEAANSFEVAWKKASRAQSYYDQDKLDLAYHELQMAIELMPNYAWKNIFSFFLYHWDFLTLQNKKELSLVYKKLKKLELPPELLPQWNILLARFELRLELPVHEPGIADASWSEILRQEREAPRALWKTWMKLIYPRLEILDTFSPHEK